MRPGPRATLTFLGTADSKGVPRFWCDCPVCTESRQTGVNRRTRTALLLRGGGEVALLDAGTDWHGQVARLPTPLVPDAVFFSHAHNDHMLGLADLLDYLRYAGGTMPMYAPEDVIPQLASRFAYAFRGQPPIRPVPAEGIQTAGFTLRLFEVPHGANGQSHAYLLERPGQRVAIVTDALDLSPEVATAWLTKLDLIVLGTSFTDESGLGPHWKRSVYDIREALELPWARAASRVILTHLSHDVDVRTVPLPEGWSFAHDGREVVL